MEKLTSNKALSLLLKDVVKRRSDLNKEENRWIKHCIYVAIASGRIADKLGLDSDYAIALGYVHDIGRKISHSNHPIAGYEYMIKEGYPEEARICLTHSFIDNKINNTAGGCPSGIYNGENKYDIINSYLICHEPTIYDNIVQMCDLFCLETGFTTVERRLLDITKRKGVFNNSLDHYRTTMLLKKRLEEEMGCSLYDLFPEIDEEMLRTVSDERKELIGLIIDEMNKNAGRKLTKN